MSHKNTKFLYTEKEVLNMSREEIMNIISIKTADGNIIYFDQISNIDFDSVNLKNGESLPIISEGKYEELSELFVRYKMFCIMHDAKGNATSLQLAEDKFEKLMFKKIKEFENLTKASTDKMVNTVEDSIKNVEDTLIHAVTPAITLLNDTSKILNDTLKSTLLSVDEKIESMDSEELNKIIKKLSKISTLLAEVVE